MAINLLAPDIRIVWHLERGEGWGSTQVSPFIYGGQQGIRATIHVGPASWPAIGRGDGYKRLAPGKGCRDLSNMRDLYICEQAQVTLRGGNKLPGIRILGEYSRGNYPSSRGRLYIHPANIPGELTGCIAPGLEETISGVKSSRRALREIYEALGRRDYDFEAGHMDSLTRWVLRVIED